MRLFDTLSGELRELELREPGKLSIYACGPTVYDAPHIGHARTALTYDLLRRYMQWRGYEVTLVSNITDIDDKIIERAAERKITEAELTSNYTDVYVDQLHDLGLEEPDARPRATQYITEMIDHINKLVDRNMAYVIEGNGVYFDVSAFEGYGALAKRTADELRDSAQGRIEADDDKHDPIDFALWKAAKSGEPTWESPWGPGRPGWHIECVAMAMNMLGPGFDIHGGGSDLAFPHHENERAEAEAIGEPFARLWMHSAMLNVDGEKMAKSVGNFRTVADAIDMYGARPLRLSMLQAHYRTVMELSDNAIAGAKGGIDRIDAFFRRASAAVDTADVASDQAVLDRFITAMDDDMGTPDALAVVFDAISAANAALDTHDTDAAAVAVATVAELLGVLGITVATQEANGDIDALVAARQLAREQKDFAESDRLRDELVAQGIEIEDTANGPVWRRV